METLGKDNPVYETDSDDDHVDTMDLPVVDTEPKTVTKPPMEASVEPGLQDQFWAVSLGGGEGTHIGRWYGNVP